MMKYFRITLWVFTFLFFFAGLCAEPQNSSEEAYYQWEETLSFSMKWFLIFLVSAIIAEVTNYFGKKLIAKDKPQKF
jgi:CDP-diglyceride synthetase